MTNLIEKYQLQIEADIAKRRADIEELTAEIVVLENLRNQIVSKNSSTASNIPLQTKLIETPNIPSSGQAERQRRIREANALKVDEFLEENNGIAATMAIANCIGLSRMATLKLLKTEKFTPLAKGNWGVRSK